MTPFDAAETCFDAEKFCGVARLFPLPNLVLYPHVMQPLHIFEDRYREMLEDALASDRLIAMALLEPGWEPDYDSRPPIAPYACLGKVVTHHRLEDGRYNLLLIGVGRIRILGELDPPRSFRRAKVELLREPSIAGLEPLRETLHARLSAAFSRFLPCSCQTSDELQQLLGEQLPLGVLTDLAAYALPLGLELKKQLLAEPSAEARARLLVEQLEHELAEVSPDALAGIFPPPFSVN